MVKIEQLRYLLELNKTDSFHKCAENLQRSQPAVSLAIKNLEKELGVDLFIRTSTGIRLTEAGMEAVKRAKKIFENVTDIYILANEYREKQETAIKEITFCASVTALSAVLTQVIIKLQKQYPTAKITSYEWEQEKSLELIQNNENTIGGCFFWEDEVDVLEKDYPGIVFEPVSPLTYFLFMDAQAPFSMDGTLYLEKSKKFKEPLPLAAHEGSSDVTWDVVNQLVEHFNAELVFQAPTDKMFYTYINQGFAAGVIMQYGDTKPLLRQKGRERYQFVPIESERKSYFYMLFNGHMCEELHQKILKYIQFDTTFL